MTRCDLFELGLRQGDRTALAVADCVELMRLLPAGSIDSVVTDPPYGLEFMGAEWDRLAGTPGYNERGRITDRPDAQVPYGRGGGVNSYQAGRPMQDWHERWAREALRVLRPGGHLFAFGGTRTYHRLASAVEDAGFEIRDCIAWLYGSGFPKSLDVAKAIDKAAGAEREVAGPRVRVDGKAPGVVSGGKNAAYGNFGDLPTTVTAPATPEAAEWEGWGTALKPAFEPIVLARKPLAGTVAQNVSEHGTGAVNIDGCRVGFVSDGDERESKSKNRHADFGSGARGNAVYNADERPRGEHGNYDAAGRWPPNVALDPEAGALLDAQAGHRGGGFGVRGRGGQVYAGGEGFANSLADVGQAVGYGDAGGASRFFYVAKAARSEREAGLRGRLPCATCGELDSIDHPAPTDANPDRREECRRNTHPTVKPIALMRWLCRLVTPPRGLVLEPFAGSGTTGAAAALEGFGFIGVEREPGFAAIGSARIDYWGDPVAHDARIRELEEDQRQAAAEERGEPVQLGLL